MYYNRLAGYFGHSFSGTFERAVTPHRPRQVRVGLRSTPSRPGNRLPWTEEDTRIHAWLNERLALLHYERHGLWPKTNRLFRAIARIMLWPYIRKGRFNTE